MASKNPRQQRIRRSANKRKERASNLYLSLNGGMEHQELEAVIADSNDAIIIFSLEKKIMSWNRSAKLLYGYTKKEALQMQLQKLVPKDSLKENLDSFEKILKGIPVKLFETKHQAKNKRRIHVWMSISALVNHQEETGAFIVTVHDVTDRKLIMENNQFLTQEIIRTQETERRRIAEGIHDDLGQSLVALKMFLLAHASDVIREGPMFKGKVDEMKKNIDDIIEKARRISHELLPPNLKHIGLSSAIKNLIKMFAGNKKITACFIEQNVRKANLETIDIALFRIVQECLNNIIKHARATRVSVTLLYKKGILKLKVYDNGRGFRANKKRGMREGVGLAIMRERARLINAKVDITSSPQKGTTVIVTLPVAERNDS
ncbi:ATP-binding protein [Candidatus Omnitrophota bacterium]